LAGCLALPLVGWLAVQATLLVMIIICGWLVRLINSVVYSMHDLVQAVLLVLAWPGETAWDWLAAMPLATKAKLARIPPPTNLPPLGTPCAELAREQVSAPATNGRAIETLIAVPALPSGRADNQSNINI
jgi:hypothetical protein